jgi:hypothetical protein
LEVFLSLAYFQQHFIQTLIALESVEQILVEASERADNRDAEGAITALGRAANRVESLLHHRNWMFSGLKQVWERSRYPKGRSVNGRDYLHVMDDLKDHPADRRPGLEYLLAPYERLRLEEWRSELLKIADEYAKRKGLESAC